MKLKHILFLQGFLALGILCHQAMTIDYTNWVLFSVAIVGMGLGTVLQRFDDSLKLHTNHE